MRAQDIVDSLLETEAEDALIPASYYLDKAHTGTVAEVLDHLGFKHDGHSRYLLRIPLVNQTYRDKYQEEQGNHDPRKVHWVEIRVGPCCSPPTGDPKEDIYFRPDHSSITYHCP